MAHNGKQDSSRQFVGSASLGAAFILVAIMIVTGLSGLGYYLLAEFERTQQLAADKRNQAVARAYAGTVSNLLRHYTALLDRLVLDKELPGLFADPDKAKLAAKENRLRRLIPHAVRLKLLRKGIGDTDPALTPPLTEACLYLQQQAEQGKTPAPDLHGAPRFHLDLLRTVKDPATGRMSGHILLTLKADSLRRALLQLQVPGYVELQQKALQKMRSVVSAGDPRLKEYPATPAVAVAGTRWVIRYWDRPGAGLFAQTKRLWYWGIVTLVGVMLLALLYFLFAALRTRLSKDQQTVITLFKDIQDGDLAETYPVRLKNSYEFIARLHALGVEALSQRRVNSPAPDDGVAGTAQQDIAETSGAAAAPQPAAGADAEDILDFSMESLIVEEQVEDEVGVPASVFRAYDIRGVVKTVLTPGLVFDIGRAIGSEAQHRHLTKIILGRDGRLSGPALRDALARGLCATGCEVIDIGQVPTPVLYFAAQILSDGTGVMITGSHNPPEYNGIKIVLGGETLHDEAIQVLRGRIEQAEYVTGNGTQEKLDVLDNYIQRVVSDVQLKRPLRVVIDCGNGVTGDVAPQLFEKLGCEVSTLYCEVDGSFPNHHPDPGKPENLQALCDKVQQDGADIGFAFDGDGDRLGVVDSEGNIIWPDRVLMVLAMAVLRKNAGGKVIYDVKCTRNLHAVIDKLGGEPIMWKTGHSFIKAKMKETGALLAGEMSGHLFFSERWYGFDDALYAGARLLEAFAAQSKSSAEVFAGLPDTVNTPELTIPMQEGEPQALMRELKKKARFKDAKLITIDGLRVEFEDSWGLVRASNTTPCLVLRFEANSIDSMARIQKRFGELLQSIEPDIDLPF